MRIIPLVLALMLPLPAAAQSDAAFQSFDAGREAIRGCAALLPMSDTAFMKCHLDVAFPGSGVRVGYALGAHFEAFMAASHFLGKADPVIAIWLKTEMEHDKLAPDAICFLGRLSSDDCADFKKLLGEANLPPPPAKKKKPPGTAP